MRAWKTGVRAFFSFGIKYGIHQKIYKLPFLNYYGDCVYSMEEKHVDMKQRRIVLPKDWVDEELGGEGDVWLFAFKGELKIVPKNTAKLSSFFDKGKTARKGANPFKDLKGALAESSLHYSELQK